MQSETRRASKTCLEARARKHTKGKTSHRQEELHEAVLKVGETGKLHLGLRKAVSHRSMLAALNRLPKHLWELNTCVLWRYRSDGLGQDTGLHALGQEGCSHRWETQY